MYVCMFHHNTGTSGAILIKLGTRMAYLLSGNKVQKGNT